MRSWRSLYSWSIPLASALVVALPLRGQPTTACGTSVARALESWIGRWYIATSDGRLQGETVVRNVAGGCGVLERWHGTSGGNGYSLSAFDAQSGEWKYLFVNDTGIVITATGRASGDTLRWKVRSFSEPRDPVDERWEWTSRDPIVHSGRVSGPNGFAWSFRYHRWADSLPPVSRHNGPCREDAERRALDDMASRSSAGQRTVTSILDGCAILEVIGSPNAPSAVRLLAWDPAASRWQQVVARANGAATLDAVTRDSARAWR